MNEQKYVLAQNPEEVEKERLESLEDLTNPVTFRHLEALGVTEGWNCLEVGAGKGSVAVWLAKQVGTNGRVLATDIDIKFLQDLNIPNLDVRQHDILKDELEESKYDLVHCRALLIHLSEPEKALEKMARATKPGGWILLEEFDFSSFGAVDPNYPSADLYNDSFRVLKETYKKGGLADLYYGRRVRGDLEQLGFLEVGNDGSVDLCRGGAEPLTRINLMNFQAGKSFLVAAGILTEEQCEIIGRLYQDPGFYFVGPTFFCAWGKRP